MANPSTPRPQIKIAPTAVTPVVPTESTPAPIVSPMPAPVAAPESEKVPLVTGSNYRLRPTVEVQPTIPSANAPKAEAARHECLDIKGLSLYYGTNHVLKDITFPVREKRVTALIGPSGCGKSTLLRCLNRMNDKIPRCQVMGQVSFHGLNIYGPEVNATRLRRFIGMVFQRSNPFPKSIFENVAFGIKLHKLARTDVEMKLMVEEALTRVGLWDEVKDRLNQNALNLSGGQQQRLCIARTIAVKPKVILMDEPASALDPLATARIEELIRELQRDYTIVLVTHNLQQAGRCSDYTAFLYLGKLVEFDETATMFSRPQQTLTENYIMGRFG